jgi:uncharacterized protein YjbI with pentapeptide repeats
LANLGGADLGEAELIGAQLPEADLRGANLSLANLSEANLNGTELSRANLIGANLSKAGLSGANLSRAILSGAEVTAEQLAQVKSLEDAILPDDTKYTGKALAPEAEAAKPELVSGEPEPQEVGEQLGEAGTNDPGDGDPA